MRLGRGPRNFKYLEKLVCAAEEGGSYIVRKSSLASLNGQPSNTPPPTATPSSKLGGKSKGGHAGGIPEKEGEKKKMNRNHARRSTNQKIKKPRL